MNIHIMRAYYKIRGWRRSLWGFVFWTPLGWVRSRSIWWSHLLFMPGYQFAGMYTYRVEDYGDVLERAVNYQKCRKRAELNVEYLIPPKHRSKVSYTHIPLDATKRDPLGDLGYVGWKYNP